MGLVSDNWFQFLGLCNHLFQFRKRRNTVAEVLFCIHFSYLSVKISRNAMTEFLYGIYTCSFEQFCKLSSNTVDTEEVSMFRLPQIPPRAAVSIPAALMLRRSASTSLPSTWSTNPVTLQLAISSMRVGNNGQ